MFVPVRAAALLPAVSPPPSAGSRSARPRRVAGGRQRRPVAALLMLSGVIALPAPAQTLPDAGALRQQIDGERKLELPGRAAPLRGLDAPLLTLPEGASITVKAFRFEGNTMLPTARLEAIVQPWLGHPIGFADIQRAAQAVAAAYRDAGWIVRTYLPKQDVTEGEILIEVVEAAYGGAYLEGPAPLRMSPEYVIEVVDAQQAPGTPANTAALDRGLLLADDLPGVVVTGALESGERDGETRLALRMTDEPFATGQVNVDNGGSRSTGPARVMASATLNSPLGIGDSLRVDLVDSLGSHYERVAFTAPLGANGLRAGVNVSRLDYRLVEDAFKALHANGNSNAWGADFSYPLVRSRQRNVYLSLNVERTVFFNRANDAVQSNYGINSAMLGLAGNVFDDLGGGGASGFALSGEAGNVNQGQLDTAEDPTVAGGYKKLHWSMSRLQNVTPALSVYGALSGQLAHDKLDSSERFYLGGPNGVRAYPINEGAGDRGELATLELRWHTQGSFTFIGFQDWGHVDDHQGSDTLKGLGASVMWNGPAGFNAQATIARRVGENPDRSTTGKDQDGSLDRVRIWVQAQRAF